MDGTTINHDILGLKEDPTLMAGTYGIYININRRKPTFSNYFL